MKKIVRAAAVTMLAAATTLVSVGPAHADSVESVICIPPSSNRATYDPPLTTTPQTVTLSVSAHFSPCVSLTQPVSSATSTGSATIPNRTCSTLVGSSSTTFTLDWDTGDTSTISADAVSTIAGGVYSVTSTGTVTAGLFEGGTYVANYTGPALEILLCQLGLGTVSSVNTVGTVTITVIG